MFFGPVKPLGNGRQKVLMVCVGNGSKMHKDIPTPSNREK